MKKKKAVALLMAAVMSVTAIPIESFAMEADSQQVSEELVLSGAEEIPSEEVFSEETEDIFTDEGNLPLEKNVEEIPSEETDQEQEETFVEDGHPKKSLRSGGFWQEKQLVL